MKNILREKTKAKWVSKRGVGIEDNAPPVEYYKGKRTKFWDGILVGLIVGYIPYLWHMNF